MLAIYDIESIRFGLMSKWNGLFSLYTFSFFLFSSSSRNSSSTEPDWIWLQEKKWKEEKTNRENSSSAATLGMTVLFRIIYDGPTVRAHLQMKRRDCTYICVIVRLYAVWRRLSIAHRVASNQLCLAHSVRELDILFPYYTIDYLRGSENRPSSRVN